MDIGPFLGPGKPLVASTGFSLRRRRREKSMPVEKGGNALCAIGELQIGISEYHLPLLLQLKSNKK